MNFLMNFLKRLWKRWRRSTPPFEPKLVLSMDRSEDGWKARFQGPFKLSLSSTYFEASLDDEKNMELTIGDSKSYIGVPITLNDPVSIKMRLEPAGMHIWSGTVRANMEIACNACNDGIEITAQTFNRYLVVEIRKL
jgi:hypothetical protein